MTTELNSSHLVPTLMCRNNFFPNDLRSQLRSYTSCLVWIFSKPLACPCVLSGVVSVLLALGPTPARL